MLLISIKLSVIDSLDQSSKIYNNKINWNKRELMFTAKLAAFFLLVIKPITTLDRPATIAISG